MFGVFGVFRVLPGAVASWRNAAKLRGGAAWRGLERCRGTPLEWSAGR